MSGAHRLRAEVEDALWELVAAGRVTADGFAALRALLPLGRERPGARGRAPPVVRALDAQAGTAGSGHPRAAGRCCARPSAAEEEDRIEALARQYVRRFGVVFRDLLRREPQAPPWRDLVRVYRRLEMRGELRGGRMVAGIVGEQFAAPEALEALRTVRRRPKNGDVLVDLGLRPPEPGRPDHARAARAGHPRQHGRLPRRRAGGREREPGPRSAADAVVVGPRLRRRITVERVNRPRAGFPACCGP